MWVLYRIETSKGQTLPFDINDSLDLQVKDTSGSYVSLFGGDITDVTVAVGATGSVATVVEYTDLLNRMDLVIIDEAHKQTFNPLLPYINLKAVVIGATATPLRRGNQECLSKFYEVLHVPVQVQELIDQGFLANPVTYGANQDLSGIRMKGNDYDTEQMATVYSKRRLIVPSVI